MTENRRSIELNVNVSYVPLTQVSDSIHLNETMTVETLIVKYDKCGKIMITFTLVVLVLWLILILYSFRYHSLTLFCHGNYYYYKDTYYYYVCNDSRFTVFPFIFKCILIIVNVLLIVITLKKLCQGGIVLYKETESLISKCLNFIKKNKNNY